MQLGNTVCVCRGGGRKGERRDQSVSKTPKISNKEWTARRRWTGRSVWNVDGTKCKLKLVLDSRIRIHAHAACRSVQK